MISISDSDTGPSRDAAHSRLIVINTRICRDWAVNNPQYKEPDHIGWYFPDKGLCRNFWRDDRSLRTCDEMQARLDFAERTCFLEFRKTVVIGGGWESRDIHGDLIECAEGKPDLPVRWSIQSMKSAVQWLRQL